MLTLGEAVPTDDNVRSLIYQLQSAASASRVDFSGLSLASRAVVQVSSSSGTPPPPGVTTGPGGFPAEPFSFTFRGNFFNLAAFFARLERFVTASGTALQVRGRLLTLDSINLAGAGGFPQIDATVAATAYLLPASQGLLAGATPIGPATSSPQVGGSLHRVCAGQLARRIVRGRRWRDRRSNELRSARRERRGRAVVNTAAITNLARSVWDDLRQKRLWPVALVMAVGLVAVPILLSRSPAAQSGTVSLPGAGSPTGPERQSRR